MGRAAAIAAGALLACGQLGGVMGAGDASLLCACPGIVWTVRPQGNKITDDIHNANVAALQAREASGGLDLAFYGDSITQHINSGDNIGAFLKYWGKYKSLAMGVGNDRIYNLFWRLKNGEMPSQPLKVAVFLIGTNDVGYTEECTRNEQDLLLAVPSINSRMRHLFDWVSQAQPKMHTVLLGILPRGGWTLDDSSSWPNRMTSTIEALNANLQALAGEDPMRHYVDCGAFALRNGTGPVNTELLPDALHPNYDGYSDLFACLQPLLDRLMAASGADVNAAVPLTNITQMVQLSATAMNSLSSKAKSEALLTEAEAQLLVSTGKPADTATALTNFGRLQASGVTLGQAQSVQAASLESTPRASGASPGLRTQPFAAPAPRSELDSAGWQRLLGIVDSLPQRPANASDPNDICLRTPAAISRNSAGAQSFSERMAASEMLNERNTPQPGCDFCPPE